MYMHTCIIANVHQRVQLQTVLYTVLFRPGWVSSVQCSTTTMYMYIHVPLVPSACITRYNMYMYYQDFIRPAKAYDLLLYIIPYISLSMSYLSDSFCIQLVEEVWIP